MLAPHDSAAHHKSLSNPSGAGVPRLRATRDLAGRSAFADQFAAVINSEIPKWAKDQEALSSRMFDAQPSLRCRARAAERHVGIMRARDDVRFELN